MCVKLFGVLLFVLFQCFSLSQCADLENEKQITELVEKILAEKTLALTNKVLSLENIVEKQQTRINYLEKRDRRNERRLKGMKKILTDIQTELKSKSLEEFDDNAKNAVRHHSDIHADKSGKTEFDDSRNVSMSLEKKTRLTETKGSGKPRQRRVPEIVAFSAYLSHRLDHMGIGHHVVFDKVLTNDGAGYNSNTGIFTVPVTGLYLFTYNANDHYDRSILQLVLDGSNVVDIIVDPDSSTEEAMSGNTAIIHVSQGQSVWIQEYIIYDGSIYSTEQARYCTFSGVLLY